jgi:MFS transporter, FSR family, fosmidomycin resistance protein
MASIALAPSSNRPLMPVLAALSVAHLLNDLIQSMIPAIYPVTKDIYHLDFARIGLITLAFQVTSSILQPVLGYLTDRRP